MLPLLIIPSRVITDGGGLDVYCVLSVEEEPFKVTANMLGPILINWEAGLGRQIVLTDSNYNTRHLVALQQTQGVNDALVLGRKNNESIIIGEEDITITILGIEGDRVKIGIQAPSHVSILRQELYETIKQENLRAVDLSSKTGQTILPSLQNLFQDKK